MDKYFLHIILVPVLIFTISCRNYINEQYFPYDINHEDESFTLPKELREISGLVYAGDRKLYCVQDEVGIVFQYDLNQKKITRKIDFAKDNDYEGIALANNGLYVLESNGNLYFIEGFEQGEELIVSKINTFLDSKCDAEGLGYDKKTNRLLIACKEKAAKGKEFYNKKAVYAFDLTTKKLQKEPAFLIKVEEVQKLKRIGDTQKHYEEFLTSIGQNNIKFKPSAIAVHPITKEIFILSSVGNTLLVMSAEGQIRYSVHLKPSDFKQAEGITFDEKGTMYISNEGRKGKGNIKVFTYKPETNKKQ